MHELMVKLCHYAIIAAIVSLFKVVDITSVIQHKGKNTTLVLDDVIVTR